MGRKGKKEYTGLSKCYSPRPDCPCCQAAIGKGPEARRLARRKRKLEDKQYEEHDDD